MATAMLYIVTEWCLQSHLSTADMSDAARGLYLTRRFRWVSSPFRDAVHYAIEGGYALRKLVLRSLKRHVSNDGTSASHQHRRSVRWTRNHATLTTIDAQVADIPLNDMTHGRPRASSDAPLMDRRDVSPGSLSASDVDASSHQGLTSDMHSPRSSDEDRTSRETESPNMLRVTDTRSTSAQSPKSSVDMGPRRS